MRQFKWIKWNLQKIDAHALSAEEVEAAFDRILSLQERKDGSFQMFAATPSGRRIWVILALRPGGRRNPGQLRRTGQCAHLLHHRILRGTTDDFAPQNDQRSPSRRLRDEQIAAEPPLALLELPPEAVPSSVEAHLARLHRRPLAIAGIVENGLVRPLRSHGEAAGTLTSHYCGVRSNVSRGAIQQDRAEQVASANGLVLRSSKQAVDQPEQHCACRLLFRV